MQFPRIEASTIGLDFETTGLEYWQPDFRVLGVAVATADSEWYWDIRKTPQVVNWLRDLMKGRLIIARSV